MSSSKHIEMRAVTSVSQEGRSTRLVFLCFVVFFAEVQTFLLSFSHQVFCMKLGKRCYNGGVGEAETRWQGRLEVVATSLLQNMHFLYTFGSKTLMLFWAKNCDRLLYL
jgi:hypothetical protein